PLPESNFPKGTDASLLAKFNNTHAKDVYYVKPKTTGSTFGVRHFAGTVTYLIDGFLDKNRDTLRQDLLDLVSSSEVTFVAELFASPTIDVVDHSGIAAVSRKMASTGSSGTVRGKKTSTLGAQFNQSLGDLVGTLTACNPFFIRCVKPNKVKKAGLIEADMVFSQLRYSGMLETIKVRSAGYSVRIKFEDLVSRYRVLCLDVKAMPLREGSMRLLEIVGSDLQKAWCIGKTMAFMKNAVETKLETLRATALTVFVVKLQTFGRMVVYRNRYKRTVHSIEVIQRFTRKVAARKRQVRFRKGVIKFQALWRGHRDRKKFSAQLELHRAEIRQAEAEALRAAEEEERKHQQEDDEDRKLDEEMSRLAEEGEAFAKQARQLRDTELNLPSESAADAAKLSNGAEVIEGDDLLSEDLEGLPEEERIRRKELLDYLEASQGKRTEKATLRLKRTRASVNGCPLPDDLENVIQNSNSPMIEPLISDNFLQLSQLDNPQDRSDDDEAIPTINSVEDLPASRRGTLRGGERPLSSQEVLSSTGLSKYARAYFREGQTLQYSKAPIKASLHKLSSAASSIAVELYKVIAQFVRTKTLSTSESFHYINYIVGKVAGKQQLQDEILCQVCKFANGSMAARAWRLLGLLLACIAPSSALMKFLPNHISSCAPEEYQPWLHRQLTRIFIYGSRRCGISSVELTSEESGRPLLLAASFVDHQAKIFEVENTTIAEEVVRSLILEKGLSSEEFGYVLVISEGSEVIRLESQDYVLDVLAMFERRGVSAFQGSHPWKLQIRKGYILPSQRFDDELDVELTCKQIIQDLDDHVWSPDEAARIRAIADTGDKLQLIEAALDSRVFYYSQLWRAKEANFDSDHLFFCVDHHGCHLLDASDATEPKRVLITCKYDDMVIVEARKSSLHIEMQGKSYEFSLKGLAVVDAIYSYLIPLQEMATFAVALHDFTATASYQISLKKNDLIEVLERDPENGWCKGAVRGKDGWFPIEYAELLLDPVEPNEDGKVDFRAAAAVRAAELEKVIKESPPATNDMSGENETSSTSQADQPLDERFSMVNYARQNFEIEKSAVQAIKATLTGTLRMRFTAMANGEDKHEMEDEPKWDEKELCARIQFQSVTKRL
ncbi:Unconventional myosin-VIIb, partial [Gonapodya sp. JEL0774]